MPGGKNRPKEKKTLQEEESLYGANIYLGGVSSLASYAWSINNNGQIVGYGYNDSVKLRACLFDPTGQGNNIDLNTLIEPSSGWTLGKAFSITNNGWVLGEGVNSAGNTEAFLLTPEPATLLLFTISGLFLRKKK